MSQMNENKHHEDWCCFVSSFLVTSVALIQISC